MKLPKLYATSSTGKVKWWSIEVLNDDGVENIITQHGYTDSDTVNEAIRVVSEGKNIGKANETTPFVQAMAEAESKWKKKKDKGYAEVLGQQPAIPRPMLAHTYAKRKKDIQFPCYVQPKLNGVRCLATRDGDSVFFLSRGGKHYTTLDHLIAPLVKLMADGETWDGEVFTTELTFQNICGAVKRQRPESALLEYWVYDVVNDDPFEYRTQHLFDTIGEEQGQIINVSTYLANNEGAIAMHHSEWVEDGYEGTIIRNRVGEYKQGHRSKDLQKHKDFCDTEYQIIGGKEGTGKDTGTIIWRCITDDGNEFDVRPRGTHEQRTKWFDNRHNYQGQLLTVRYQNLSDGGIPIFPVGVSIRDYE
jgi:DNA ligase-1